MKYEGSRFGFCPICKLYLHHSFLVIENTLGTQKIGLVCDSCKSANASITRSRKNGHVISSYLRPGFRQEQTPEKGKIITKI